ncbi:ankyrin-3-like [Salvia divinorum]|uniref:Ankyrin-3-like n=1 Tax=Salvia divinorum TaxID=28513 RepID=A0ABD1H1I0_SALDI
MDSTAEMGAAIIEAGAGGDLNQLRVITNKFDVLHHVVEIGNFEICKFLTGYSSGKSCQRGTCQNCGVSHQTGIPNIEGFTPLHYAVLKDNMEVMELLKIKGARVEAASADGTPLQIAVSRGNVQAVKYLLSHGADPDLFCAAVDTPLVCAVKSRSFECLKLLLAANANPNLYFSLSPLASAAKEGDTKCLKCLLKAKAGPNSDTYFHDLFKPIEDAAMVHNRAAVEILFPVTKRLAIYPNWTVDGIIEYIHSQEFKTLREQKMTMRLTELGIGGMHGASNKQYSRAILLYRKASLLDPSNPTWISKRSLLPPVSHPHYGGDIANEIFRKFFIAGLAFSLDPYNEAIFRAFRLTLFDYFASFSQMSGPGVILSFS